MSFHYIRQLAVGIFATFTSLVMAWQPSDPWTPPDSSQWTCIIKNVMTSETAASLTVDSIAPPVAVDRTTGWAYIYGQGNGGKLLVSKNQGQTFSNTGYVGNGFIFYTPFCISPDGGKFASISASNSSGYSLDTGKTWNFFKADSLGYIEQATLNWDDDAKIVLARDHGPNNLWVSSDGGQHFRRTISNTSLGTNMGVLQGGVLVTQQGYPEDNISLHADPLMRSTDTGRTWVSLLPPANPGTAGLSPGFQFILRVITFKGVPYWLSSAGVYTTADTGITWTVVGSPFPTGMVGSGKQPMLGPFFGKDENQIIVMMQNQFIESLDKGVTWHALAQTPRVIYNSYAMAFCGYDPILDILYFSSRHDGGAHSWTFNNIYRLPLGRWGKTDSIAPAKPPNLRATQALPGNRVQLAWSPSTDISGINKYDVYLNGVMQRRISDTAIIFRDLSYQTQYAFSVRAMDAVRNLSDTSSIVFTTGDSLKSAYLSDLNWVSATCGAYTASGSDPGHTVKKDVNAWGNPIQIYDKYLFPVLYRKGLGVSVDNVTTKSEIIYSLGGQYNHFLCNIGSPYNMGGAGQFEVYADNVRKVQSGWMALLNGDMALDINIAGVDTLKLVLNGSSWGCAGNWADAMVVYDPSTSVQSAEVTAPKAFGMTLIGSNPFNGVLPVRYQTPVADNVRLSVYNLAGQLVRTVADGRMNSGTHTCAWDGRNSRGEKALSGVYLIRLETKTQNRTLKAVYLK